MANTDTRRIVSLRIEPETHKKLKLIAIEEETTLQKYLMNLVDKDLRRRERANVAKQAD